MGPRGNRFRPIYSLYTSNPNTAATTKPHAFFAFLIASPRADVPKPKHCYLCFTHKVNRSDKFTQGVSAKACLETAPRPRSDHQRGWLQQWVHSECMSSGAKATHLSCGLQVVADKVLLGGWRAVEKRPSEPAHAQEEVGEAQVEEWTNLGKGILSSRSE